MSHFIRVYILAVLPLFASLAFAQVESGTSALRLPELGSSAGARVTGANSFKVEQSQYVDYGLADYRKGAAHQNSSLILRLDDQIEKRGFSGKIKAKDEWRGSENWNYGDINELYASYKTESTQVSVGRKLETWSAWDSEWRQGIFQSRYMENGLRSEEAGLTGAFLSMQGESAGFTLAALPGFIPDMGPHFTIADDKFVSANPWFHPPSDKFKLRTGTGNIHYKVDHPPAEVIAAHPGAAGKVEYRNKNYTARVSGAYKPMSELLLGFPSAHQFAVGHSTDQMNITVEPRVAYDRIASFDNLYTTGQWSFTLSAAYDNPVDQAPPADWTSQQVRPATIFSGSVERQLEDDGPHAARIRLGFLKVTGGDADDRGLLASKDSLFDRRFQFYEAYLLGFKSEFRNAFQFPVDTELRLIYDRMQGGAVISVNGGVNFSRNFRADIQADFMGLLTANANITDGFISTYRANDRLGLGMAYVF